MAFILCLQTKYIFYVGIQIVLRLSLSSIFSTSIAIKLDVLLQEYFEKFRLILLKFSYSNAEKAI